MRVSPLFVEVKDKGYLMTENRVMSSGAFKQYLDRDLLSIKFKCDGGCTATLRIRQHKGNTYLYWEDLKTKEEVNNGS